VANPKLAPTPQLGSEATMKMNTRLARVAIGSLCLLATPALAGSSAHAQTYPAGPVRFITQVAAGSATDPAMRIVADHLGRTWGQQAVVINQPGAGGIVAMRVAVAAPPDGHTLYMAIATNFIVPPIQANPAVNVSAFVPIGFIGEVPMGIAVSPTLPVNSLPELIGLSKRHSGGLNVAVGLRGGMPHLTSELLRSRSGADLTIVHYSGASAHAMSDVISGRVPIVVEGLAGPLGGAQLKLLAIAAPTRLASRPDVPTVAETLPGFVATGWFVLMAPPGTPDAIVKKVSDDLREVLARADVKRKFDELSISTRAMSPQELSAFIRSEQQLWTPVIKQIGLAAQ
jgi:tripartite-type tricarboxylate transporter receptor subunit TctC